MISIFHIPSELLCKKICEEVALCVFYSYLHKAEECRYLKPALKTTSVPVQSFSMRVGPDDMTQLVQKIEFLQWVLFLFGLLLIRLTRRNRKSKNSCGGKERVTAGALRGETSKGNNGTDGTVVEAMET